MSLENWASFWKDSGSWEFFPWAEAACHPDYHYPSRANPLLCSCSLPFPFPVTWASGFLLWGLESLEKECFVSVRTGNSLPFQGPHQEVTWCLSRECHVKRNPQHQMHSKYPGRWQPWRQIGDMKNSGWVQAYFGAAVLLQEFHLTSSLSVVKLSAQRDHWAELGRLIWSSQWPPWLLAKNRSLEAIELIGFLMFTCSTINRCQSPL